MNERKKMEPKFIQNGTIRDETALADWQKHYLRAFTFNTRLEDEAYLSQHPEIGAMIKSYLSNLKYKKKTMTQKEVIESCHRFFSQEERTLDEEIRKVLNLPNGVPYSKEGCPPYIHKEVELLITPPDDTIIRYSTFSESVETETKTATSSFLSQSTSTTTQTPREPTPPPEPTLYECLLEVVSNAVDKAFYTRFDDYDVLYDTAYVEISKAVEAAMEIPVVDIKKDIIEMIDGAWCAFDYIIIFKAEAYAMFVWQERMRKKFQRKTKRKYGNFLGYQSSESSSDEDYVTWPCPCHLPFKYNRYPKNRFGVYLPQNSIDGTNMVTKASLTSSLATPSGATEYSKSG